MKDGTRSGLWSEFARAIDALKPKVVVIENVRGLLSAEAGSDVEPCPWCLGDDAGQPALRALGAVLGDLDELGFDAEWTGLRAADVGAPHGRFRVFVVAYRHGLRLGSGWNTAPREASGWWASTVDSGRGGAPVELLGTPTARDWKDGTEADVPVNGLLGRQVWYLFPTITASEGDKGGPNQAHGGGDRTLSGTVTTTPQGNVVGEVAWGPYEPAVRLWESLTREAPAPTLPDGKNGNHRLSARFTEWMMGYPLGWVTDVIGRNPAIKACGNGVCTPQAFAALNILWPRVMEQAA